MAARLTHRVASLGWWFHSPQEQEFILHAFQSNGTQSPVQ